MTQTFSNKTPPVCGNVNEIAMPRNENSLVASVALAARQKIKK